VIGLIGKNDSVDRPVGGSFKEMPSNGPKKTEKEQFRRATGKKKWVVYVGDPRKKREKGGAEKGVGSEGGGGQIRGRRGMKGRGQLLEKGNQLRFLCKLRDDKRGAQRIHLTRTTGGGWMAGGGSWKKKVRMTLWLLKKGGKKKGGRKE